MTSAAESVRVPREPEDGRVIEGAQQHLSADFPAGVPGDVHIVVWLHA